MTIVIIVVVIVVVTVLMTWAAARQRRHPGQTGADGSEHGNRSSPRDGGSGGDM